MKYFSGGAQRSAMVASPDCRPIGNSARKIKRTLPLSMYSRLKVGNVSARNLRQIGQVIEAYWTTVTGASLRPSAISGSSPGLRISSGDGLLITSRRPRSDEDASENGLNFLATAVVTPASADGESPSFPASARVRPGPPHPPSAAASTSANN